MGQIDGYKVVVAATSTAAIPGLAGAAVRRTIREGARVTLVTPPSQEAKSLVGSLGKSASVIETQLRDFGAATARAAEQMGGLDALVNIVQPDSPWEAFEQKGAAGFAAAFDGLSATLAALQAAWPHLKRRGEGARVVNVGSVYGSSSYAHVSDSVTSDYALQGITRAIAVEWASTGVRVNFLGPGALAVPEFRRWHQQFPAAVDHRVGGLAMRRLGTLDEDFGGALMLLLSDESCFLVGQTLYADGGQHLVAPVLEPGVKFA